MWRQPLANPQRTVVLPASSHVVHLPQDGYVQRSALFAVVKGQRLWGEQLLKGGWKGVAWSGGDIGSGEWKAARPGPGPGPGGALTWLQRAVQSHTWSGTRDVMRRMNMHVIAVSRTAISSGCCHHHRRLNRTGGSGGTPEKLTLFFCEAPSGFFAPSLASSATAEAVTVSASGFFAPSLKSSAWAGMVLSCYISNPTIPLPVYCLRVAAIPVELTTAMQLPSVGPYVQLVSKSLAWVLGRTCTYRCPSLHHPGPPQYVSARPFGDGTIKAGAGAGRGGGSRGDLGRDSDRGR